MLACQYHRSGIKLRESLKGISCVEHAHYSTVHYDGLSIRRPIGLASRFTYRADPSEERNIISLFLHRRISHQLVFWIHILFNVNKFTSFSCFTLHLPITQPTLPILKQIMNNWCYYFHQPLKVNEKVKSRFTVIFL